MQFGVGELAGWGAAIIRGDFHNDAHIGPPCTDSCLPEFLVHARPFAHRSLTRTRAADVKTASPPCGAAQGAES
jgi:hypothetical protein